jgi:glucose-1-phosphate thymidylyltransferase
MQSRRPIHAFTFDGAWFDIGTPESYLEAVAWELDGGNLVAESATVEGSEIRENVHVLPDAEVLDSTVEASVIFPEATVEDSELRQSIIDKDTHVENLDLAGALIGAHTTITNGDDR